MESTGRRARRAFTDEYKAEVVELCRTSGKTIAAVARDLGLTATVVRRWVTQAAIDNGRRDGLSTADRDEIVRLRKEVRALRSERRFSSRPRPDERLPVHRGGESCSAPRRHGVRAA